MLAPEIDMSLRERGGRWAGTTSHMFGKTRKTALSTNYESSIIRDRSSGIARIPENSGLT